MTFFAQFNLRALKICAATAVLLALGLTGPAGAQTSGFWLNPSQDQTGQLYHAQSNRYVPTIWVDPDGCEHWVMDDGTEGYMTPNVNRQGIPVCNRGNICGVMNSDALFASNSANINHTGVSYLQQFFASSPARGFIVVGHTDSRASDDYNLRLSLKRANAVAGIARSVGAPVLDIRGYGERYPRATNSNAHGRAQNRRVEIICVN